MVKFVAMCPYQGIGYGRACFQFCDMTRGLLGRDMSKIVSIGECLVDVTPTQNGYENRIGGAPYNVCACVVRLGGEGYYLGKLGGDEYASFLLEKIKENGVKTDYISIDKSLKTALARITLDESGDRTFSFFRENTADLNLSADDIPEGVFSKGDILHFCSVALQNKSLIAHKKAIKLAKRVGALISFDVNVRLNLWENIDECIATIKEFLAYADIVKVSKEELDLLTQDVVNQADFGGVHHIECEEDKIARFLELAHNAKLVIVTKGAEGAVAYDRCINAVYSPAVKVEVKNATGAGDNFIGAFLFKLISDKITLENISKNVVKNLLDFANMQTAKFLANN